jgi:hypothetical protein
MCLMANSNGGFACDVHACGATFLGLRLNETDETGVTFKELFNTAGIP